jgi:uncharacterized membrane protein YkgB
MNALIRLLTRAGLLSDDLDYHLVRVAMVLTFLLFGYQKWFPSEAEALFPFIISDPLTFWLYPAFGIRGAAYALLIAEWLVAAFLFLGFWNVKLGILGSLASCLRAIATLTMLLVIPDAWDASAGGFPAMTPIGAFLVKDLAMLAASFYLLRQDVLRAARTDTHGSLPDTVLHLSHGRRHARATASHDHGTAA